MTTEFEDVQKFWERAGQDAVGAACQSDAILRFFDKFSVLEVIEGKVLKFDVDKIAELQDKVDSLPAMNGDDSLRKIFAPGATKSATVRNHKLVAVIKEGLTNICESGEVPSTGGSASAPEPASDYSAPEGQQSQQASYIQLARDLPEGARINVRCSPDTDAEVVGTIGEDDVIAMMSMQGDWACIDFDGSTAYVLTRMGDRALLVPMNNSQPAPVAAKENQGAANHAAAAAAAAAPMKPPQPVMQQQHQQQMPQHAQPPRVAPPTMMAHHAPSMHQQYMPQSSMHPMAMNSMNEDPSRPVSFEEYNQLRFRVQQLEADMRAFRMLMRSWSLDTPSAAAAPY